MQRDATDAGPAREQRHVHFPVAIDERCASTAVMS